MTGNGARLAAALAVLLALGVGARALAAEPRGADADRALERRFDEEVSGRPYLQYVTLEVRASDGALTLLGRAGSELERGLLRLLARNLSGVASVSDEVRLDESLPRWRPGPAEARRTRARNVQRRIRSDPELAVFTTVHTFVDGETLRLRGAVARPWQHELALALAREASRPRGSVGVGAEPGVVDELAVREDASRAAPLPPPDAASQALELELDLALASDPLLRDVPVAASVRDGEVVLVGHAARAIEQDYALEAVRARLLAALRSFASMRPPPLGPFASYLATGALDAGHARAEVEPPRSERFLLSSRVILDE